MAKKSNPVVAKLRTVAVIYTVSEQDFNGIIHALHGPPSYKPTVALPDPGTPPPGETTGTASPSRHAAPPPVLPPDALVIELPAPVQTHGPASVLLHDLLQKSVGAAATSLAWEQSFRRMLWKQTKLKAGK